MQRVFSNLLGNAAKYTPPDGQINITVQQHERFVRVSVSDSGPGVPREQRPHLFDRYWQGKKGSHGLGLGLYIAKCIVEAHGGRIWMAERDGGGATFCFDLPVAKEP